MFLGANGQPRDFRNPNCLTVAGLFSIPVRPALAAKCLCVAYVRECVCIWVRVLEWKCSWATVCSLCLSFCNRHIYLYIKIPNTRIFFDRSHLACSIICTHVRTKEHTHADTYTNAHTEKQTQTQMQTQTQKQRQRQRPTYTPTRSDANEDSNRNKERAKRQRKS